MRDGAKGFYVMNAGDAIITGVEPFFEFCMKIAKRLPRGGLLAFGTGAR